MSLDLVNLVERAWNTVWDNKYLIILGIIFAFLGGRTQTSSLNFNVPSTGGGFDGSGGFEDFNEDFGDDFGEQMPPPETFEELLEDMGLDPAMAATMGALGLGIVIVIVLIVIVISLVAQFFARVAEGGMIGGVNQINAGQESSFGLAWGAGWRRALPMFGIYLVRAIPGLVFAIGVLIWVFTIIGSLIAAPTLESGIEGLIAANAVILILVIATGCVVAIISLVLNALGVLADRATMIEQTNVWASFRRAIEVIREKPVDVVLLFLAQWILRLLIAAVLFLPGAIAALCCLFWPLLLAVTGLIEAFFSAVWTLAWMEWTGGRSEPVQGSGPAFDVGPEPVNV
ncbi:MAG: hypothetical protein GYB68_19355 [Chloroflexi bacterium]|nr:hypothetical protein [Chloroflexota bacterium]